MHITERRDGTIRIELRGEHWDINPMLTADSEYREKPVQVGDEGCLLVAGRSGREDVAALRPGPIPGNLNHHITRCHGWRGTTGDVARYAMGWRRVESVTPRRRGGGLVIILSADLRPDED